MATTRALAVLGTVSLGASWLSLACTGEDEIHRRYVTARSAYAAVQARTLDDRCTEEPTCTDVIAILESIPAGNPDHPEAARLLQSIRGARAEEAERRAAVAEAMARPLPPIPTGDEPPPPPRPADSAGPGGAPDARAPAAAAPAAGGVAPAAGGVAPAAGSTPPAATGAGGGGADEPGAGGHVDLGGAAD